MRFLLYFGVIFIWVCGMDGYAQLTQYIYLSGVDKDNSVNWDFFCTAGSNSGKWSKIAVPSNWELQGFGTYNYGCSKESAIEKGLYKSSFTIPESWKGKEINIVFEGSMFDTEVKINGKSAGEMHHGGFTRFWYPVTKLLKVGSTNLLEVNVAKVSSDSLVNDAEHKADSWFFGGIYRPVYLEALPSEYIKRVSIDARADGSFCSDVFTVQALKNYFLAIKIFDSNGVQLGRTVTSTLDKLSEKTTISAKFIKPLLWNPESPNLYVAEITLKTENKLVHIIRQKFGFRTVEVRRRDGIYINSKKTMFRGICYRGFWPTSGYCTSKELSILDVNLMKDMNVNAVRMSSSPADSHFLDVCDSLGLFVLVELDGYPYSCFSMPMKQNQIEEVLVRDLNHPSVILWNHPDDASFNSDILKVYDTFDIQKRPVVQPSSILNGLQSFYNPGYGYGVNTFFNGRDIFFAGEFLTGLYDGGMGAGLDDFWNLMMSNPLSAGGFLSTFADEGVVRRDLNDSIDISLNMAANGIVGPYREKEGSFYTVKDIWSPVQFEKKEITDWFQGTFRLMNRFQFTNLNQCTFSFQLVRFPDNLLSLIRKVFTGTIESPDMEPGGKGNLTINLPNNWKEFDVLYINILDPFGRNINTWSWNICTPSVIANRMKPVSIDPVRAIVDPYYIFISSAQVEVTIDKSTGSMVNVRKNSVSIPFRDGPVFSSGNTPLKQLNSFQKGDDYVIECTYEGEYLNDVKWIMHPGGWLQLDYSFRPIGSSDFVGISFSYPEEKITGVKLLANGPYRVWKNRLRGQQFGLYDKKYNNTITGEYLWEYPEFKGYYSDFYAVTFETNDLPFTIVSATEDLYLQLFTPDEPKWAENENTAPAFPQAAISILHGISGIGTKFKDPADMSPQGKPNEYFPNTASKNLNGTLYFKFGDDLASGI